MRLLRALLGAPRRVQHVLVVRDRLALREAVLVVRDLRAFLAEADLDAEEIRPRGAAGERAAAAEREVVLHDRLDDQVGTLADELSVELRAPADRLRVV